MMTNTSPDSLLENYSIRACYADTDAAGVIHHARILEFFERSRTEWLYRAGAGPRQLELLNLLLVIREVTMTFHQPGRLDDQLFFSHKISQLGNSQLTLEQSVYRNVDNNPISEQDRLSSATFHLVCVNTETMKSTSLPRILIAASEISA